jgi:pimeloyl-ACP methyl ester carboxylesterase
MAEYLDLRLDRANRDTLSALTRKVEDSTSASPERLAAGVEIAYRLLQAAGVDTSGRRRQIETTVGRAVSGNYRLGMPFTYATTPPNALPEVIRRGRGPVTLILIPDYRKNWRIYQRFIEANEDRFTMFTFSLPGYGGTRPYEMPRRAAFGERVWLENVAAGIIRFIESEQLARPILVGTLDGGTYLAIRAATLGPDRIAGVVSLNGDLYDPSIRSASDTAARLSEAERAAIVPRVPGTILWPVFAPPQRHADTVEMLWRRPIPAQHPIRVYTRDSSWTQEVYRMHLAFAPFLERYDMERQTADLRSAVGAIRVPVLAIPSTHDEKSLTHGERAVHLQWVGVQKEFPRTPVTVVPFENVRALVAIDAPRELGDAIQAFAARQPVIAPTIPP